MHYEVLADRNEQITSAAGNGFRRRVRYSVKALEGVSFELRKGDALGLIGHNGAGKTTLLQVIGGLLQPSSGKVLVSHQPQLLGVAAALNPRISGRLNVELGCLALGMTRPEIAEATPEIIEFTDLAEFIDLPVNTYSAGMRARLSFAISTVSRPEILLIDEALAVGDKDFKARSLGRLRDLRDGAGVVVMASHALGEVARSCNRVVWLHEGQIRMAGSPDDVLTAYREEIAPVHRKVVPTEDVAPVQAAPAPAAPAAPAQPAAPATPAIPKSAPDPDAAPATKLAPGP